MRDRIALGRLGEAAACEYLEQQERFRIVARNFRCPMGEVDIIGWHQDVLVFVEVRSRSSSSFAMPEETVNFCKQNKLRRLAAYYLAIKIGREVNCRFDVVTVRFGEGKDNQISHYQGAF